jgi:aryl-alcohol dehydrogenase-like predicted oxidoreductase
VAAVTIARRPLGSQGLETSAQGLGCMSMSAVYGPGDEDSGIATIHRALDIGVTLLDTANIYGATTNEVLVGRAIAGRRDEVQLATKFGIVMDLQNPANRGVNGKPEYVHQCCDESLERLGVDHIDLYYQHRPDATVPIEETVGAMAELQQAGKIRFLGLSEAAPDTIRRAHATHPITALQSEWSLWSRDIEDGVIDTCRELGIGIVPFSPLGRGFLSGEITSPDDFDARDFRRSQPRFQGENFTKNLDIVDRVKALADAKGVTPAQVALAWAHRQGDDVFPIPGTKRTARLEENVAALDVVLTDAEIAELDSLMDTVAGPQSSHPIWTRIETPMPS